MRVGYGERGCSGRAPQPHAKSCIMSLLLFFNLLPYGVQAAGLVWGNAAQAIAGATTGVFATRMIADRLILPTISGTGKYDFSTMVRNQ